jgi:hypothetical protein
MRAVSLRDFRDAGDAFCELLVSERRRGLIGALRLLEETDSLEDCFPSNIKSH